MEKVNNEILFIDHEWYNGLETMVNSLNVLIKNNVTKKIYIFFIKIYNLLFTSSGGSLPPPTSLNSHGGFVFSDVSQFPP